MPPTGPIVFNTDAEKNLLAKSLKNVDDVGQAIESLKIVVERKTPFGLYIATLDRSNCMWIFKPEVVYYMLGGEDIHKKTFNAAFEGIEDKSEGILFYVLRKVGPIVTVRLSTTTIRSVIDSLESDVANL